MADAFEEGMYETDIVYTDASSLAEKEEPRILLMGPSRSGKSSIQRVVFHKMSPHETLFLEQTTEVQVKEVHNNALVRYQILDFPGGFMFNEGADDADGADGGKVAAHEPDPTVVFSRGGAVVFVVDGQDDGSQYAEAAEHFARIAEVARVNPKVCFFVLINKVDGDSYLSDDHKMDCQRDIQNHIFDALADVGLKNVHPTFLMTSIYDNSVFDAFSKVVQRLTPELGFLESLLDSLMASCEMEKAFLFDVISKVVVATDSSPMVSSYYELCSDMIDLVIDVACIYGKSGDVSDTLSSDASSGVAIKLESGVYLVLKEVSPYLALVCMMKSESYAKSGLVEYNVAQFKKALGDLFAAKNKAPASA